VIEANGIPAHEFGPFPNAGNPFAVRPQRHRFVVSAAPVPLAVPIPIRFVEFGVALNGVPFDPAGPFWNGDNRSGWQFEVMSATARRHLGLDDNDAHTQPGGAYHYHGVPQGYLRERGIGDEPGPRMVHLGYAADGFPIYWRWGHAVADDPTSPLVELASGYRLKSGPRVGGPGGRHDGSLRRPVRGDAGLAGRHLSLHSHDDVSVDPAVLSGAAARQLRRPRRRTGHRRRPAGASAVPGLTASHRRPASGLPKRPRVTRDESKNPLPQVGEAP